MTAYPGVAQIRAHPRRDTSWQEYAACVDANPAIFFEPSRYTEALSWCAQCPVQKPCHELGRGQADGVWGNRIHQKYGGRSTA